MKKIVLLWGPLFGRTFWTCLNPPLGAQTCALPLVIWRLTPMTLKLESYGDIWKMYPHTENEAASLRHSKRRAWIGKKYENVSRSKCQRLWITSSVIVTDIPIKPQQFPASSFWVACYSFFAAVTLTFGQWPWNWTVTYENKVARLSHSKYKA